MIARCWTQVCRIGTELITPICLLSALLLTALTTLGAVLPQATTSASGSNAAPPPVSLQSIEVLPGLRIMGTIGALFRIECRNELAQTDDWYTLKNLILPNSPYLFIETNATSTLKRFYRVTSDPRPPQLVWINPGACTLGSPINEDDRSGDEDPQTAITILKGFWMGKYEATQVDYMSVMGIDPSAFADDLNRPVESVTWNDATNYCVKLTEQERRAGRLPTGYLYRLPTEGEWEYAARAGTETRFSYGDDPGYTLLDESAWSGVNSAETTHPVGTKLPNPWGLYDMHGNVWEWCSDRYAGSYPGGSISDPQGPVSGSGRVIRGGSWKGLTRFCRSASRGSGDPLIPGNNVGFRVVLAAATPR
ncbi:MAG: formylglycine-generating enzyme family protein [Verrucomicrobiota bacterium]